MYLMNPFLDSPARVVQDGRLPVMALILVSTEPDAKFPLLLRH
jgi:hypothetical protein